MISNDLKWNENTANIVKKANTRMELLRKVAGFGTPPEDMKRSLLDQSATVWHSSISLENAEDLERVQKSALKVILQDQYKGYKNALNRLDLESLHERRENLCLNFAIKCTKNKKLENMFPKNSKKHDMK